ncbi:MAG TPA: fasciclin domain-containing protein [Candidatus Acidoferrales bacterium]|nr:fasciclin domain-containing protein [Candidatus Acidoferrales bacterium]
MTRILAAMAVAGLLSLGVPPVFAQSSMSGSNSMTQQNPSVGGAPMYAEKNIVQNAMNSPINTTLVSLVKKAGLVQTLEGPGPYTVFAPTNKAFDKVPKSTLSKVQSNDAMLKQVLEYHVVPGRLTTKDIQAKIEAGGGKAELKTVEGQPITATMNGSQIELSGAGGGTAMITTADVAQSNGEIQVINGVLMP